MTILASNERQGVIGITGHAGAGHVHSNHGFVQDDSGGFVVSSRIITEAYPVDTAIESAEADMETGWITVRVKGGGEGRARARRGVTPYEVELMQRVIGFDARFTQAAAFRAFGRIYGQGALEVPVAFQAAVCRAVMDALVKAYPEAIFRETEETKGRWDMFIATVVEMNGVPVSVMAVLNACDGGLGPDEDLEGNVLLGTKAELMRRVGMDAIPTIIIEGKAYLPAMKDQLTEATHWVRANAAVDNVTVYNALCEGLAQSGLPGMSTDSAYPRNEGEMAAATDALGQKVVAFGEQLRRAETSREKIAAISELARLVSEDAGGISFMTNSLHTVVRGGGLTPGMSAVLSMAVPASYIGYWKIPEFDRTDSDNFLAIIEKSVAVLNGKLAEARAEISEKCDLKPEAFEHLFG